MSTGAEKFYDLTGRVFALLYEKHPVPITLSGSEFFPLDPTADFDEAFAPTDWQFFEYTMNWLQTEGYLRFQACLHEENYDPSVLDCQLSAKGLYTLTKPSILDPKGKSMGGQLIDLVKSAAGKSTATLAVEGTKFEFIHMMAQLFT